MTQPERKTERYILADLKLDTALHIGTGKGGNPTDSPLRRASDGRLVLSGRSLGGALRTLATRLAPRLGLGTCKALIAGHEETPCRCDVCRLFGELYPSEEDAGAQGGTASLLWISDAYAKEGEPQTHVRDGVGIARNRGTAAANVKFDLEVALRDTVFSVRMRLVDTEPSDDADKRAMLLVAALDEWAAGRGRLGGNVARGLGRFTLTITGCKRTQVETGEQLIAFLKSDRPWALGVEDSEWLERSRADRQGKIQPWRKEAPMAGGFVMVEFTLGSTGPFLINDPLVAALSGFDHAPLLEVAFGDNRRPVLSGGSLRGALRSRAEKIARTLATRKHQTREAFLEHCPACDPLVGQKEATLASCDARLSISDEDEVPEEALCLSCRLFGSTRRGSRLWVDDATWDAPDPTVDDWKAQDFLAIDRFTGGGLDGAKFDAAPLTKARFTARLTLYDPKEWELGWLLLVLRDLAEGEIPIGFGAAKGYGRARASGFQWTVGYLKEGDVPDTIVLPEKREPSGVYQLAKLTAATGVVPAEWQAQTWITDFKAKAEAFDLHEKLGALKRDTFFDEDGLLLRLYGLPSVGGER